MYAAECGSADCVRLLMDAGANKEARDKVRLRFESSFIAYFVSF